jgi:hypothetical protein
MLDRSASRVLTNSFWSPGMNDLRLGDAFALDSIDDVFRGLMQHWLLALPEVAPRRDWNRLRRYELDAQGHCRDCDAALAACFRGAAPQLGACHHMPMRLVMPWAPSAAAACGHLAPVAGVAAPVSARRGRRRPGARGRWPDLDRRRRYRQP